MNDPFVIYRAGLRGSRILFQVECGSEPRVRLTPLRLLDESDPLVVLADPASQLGASAGN